MILFREIVEARVTVLGDPELMEKQLRACNGEIYALAIEVDKFLGTLGSRFATGRISWNIRKVIERSFPSYPCPYPS